MARNKSSEQGLRAVLVDGRAAETAPLPGSPPTASGLRAVLVDDRNRVLGPALVLKLRYIAANRVTNVETLLWTDVPIQPVGILVLDPAGRVVYAQGMTNVDDSKAFRGRTLVDKGCFQIPVRATGEVGRAFDYRSHSTGASHGG